jgi:hypothetical protein
MVPVFMVRSGSYESGTVGPVGFYGGANGVPGHQNF